MSFGRPSKENTRVLGLPIALDVSDRENQAIMSAESWFGHCAFAETVCGGALKKSVFSRGNAANSGARRGFLLQIHSA